MSTTRHLDNLCESIDELEKAVNRLTHVPKFLRDAVTTAKGRRIAAGKWMTASADVQGELFGSTPPGGIVPTGKRDTSLQAAHSQSKGGKAGNDRLRILEALSVYACTTDALEQRTGMKHQTCSARVFDLNKSGLIFATDRREKTRSGSPAIVWAITKAGQQALESSRLPR